MSFEFPSNWPFDTFLSEIARLLYIAFKPRRAGRCLIKQQLKNNTSMIKIIDFWTPAKDHGM